MFVFIQAFRLLSPILLSFLLVMLISMAVNPVISWMRAMWGGRKSTTGLVVGALVVVIGLTGWAIFGPMKDQVMTLSEELPAYWESFQKPLIKMEQQAVLSEEKLQAEVTGEIAEEENLEASRQIAETATSKPTKEAESLRSSLSDMFQKVVDRFTKVAVNTGQILVVLVTVFFGVTFTLMNPRPIFRGIFSMLPEQHHKQALVIIQRIGNFAPRWIATTLLRMLTIGLLVVLLMWPIFGLKDALVLGLIAGILEAVPLLGPILSTIPAILLALGKGGMTPLWVLLAFLAVQALESNVIAPFIMARGMKIHPLAVIFSMLLCVAALGVLGVLVAAPLVSIFDICHDELYRKRYLPTTTDADLELLAKSSLFEK